MRSQTLRKQARRKRRTMSVRNRLRGSSLKPRLCVVKSNKHIHAQLIDDESGKTLGFIGTTSKELQNTEFTGKNKTSARKLGSRIAEIAKEKNIKEVVFDRGPFKYHGLLAELANAAREGGLKF